MLFESAAASEGAILKRCRQGTERGLKVVHRTTTTTTTATNNWKLAVANRERAHVKIRMFHTTMTNVGI